MSPTNATPVLSRANSLRSEQSLLPMQQHCVNQSGQSMRRWWPFKSQLNKCTHCQHKPQTRCTHLSEAQKQGLGKINSAINISKGRLQAVETYLPTCKDALRIETYNAAQQRLRLRVNELQKLQKAFQNNPELTFSNFSGWFDKDRAIPNTSQFDTFTYQKNNGSKTENVKAPLSSRIKSTTGQETLFLIGQEDHGNHQHSRLSFDLSQHADLRVAIKNGSSEESVGNLSAL